MTSIKAYNGDEPYIFISYSHKDTEIGPILQEIYSNEYRFWYDEGIISGRAWAAEISKRLKNCCQFVVFISENSVASENVKDEVHLAVKHRLDIQVVYLHDVVLDGELELHLDRKQAISKPKYSSDEAFYKKLISGLSNDALAKSRDAVTQADGQFRSHYTVKSTMMSDKDKTTYLAVKNSLSVPTVAKHFRFKKSIYGSEVMNSALNEVSILKDLQNQNCPFTPRVFDYFEDKENIFIVEEYVRGQTLEQVMRTLKRHDPVSLQDTCVEYCIKLCRILRYLHNLESPIVHRDIKPRNVLVTQDNDVFLIDFDICLRYKQAKPFGFASLGTRGYASPEQYSSERVPDNRSDIYSLGVLLRQLLSGESPLEHWRRETAPLRYYSERFSPVLENIILKMTKEDAAERYASVEEVLAALQNYKNVTAAREWVLRMESNRRVKEYKKRLEKERQASPISIPLKPPAVPVPSKKGVPVPPAVPVPPKKGMPVPPPMPYAASAPMASSQPAFVVPPSASACPVSAAPMGGTPGFVPSMGETTVLG